MAGEKEDIIYVDIANEGENNEHIFLTEDAHIRDENVLDMKFVFDKPADITDSIKKSNATSDSGRIQLGCLEYGRVKVVYPDGSQSVKAYLGDCVLQYCARPDKRYGVTCVCLGVTTSYIRSIISGASSSGVKLKVKDNVKESDGYWWLSASVDDFNKDTMVVTPNDDGTLGQVNLEVLPFLSKAEKNL